MISPDRSPREPWYQKFHDLMPFRVREILLVSSPYDAFTLEEDGRLTEQIFTNYSELHLYAAPRITHVSTAARAMEQLAARHYDLVLTMVRIPDMEVSAFARQVKDEYPSTPVVLLVLTESDLGHFPDALASGAIDDVFWWTGDARLLLSIIKLSEDRLNAPHDARAGVRVIIVVEDSIRRYSSFLSEIYEVLMTQSSSLVAEGVNDLHRLVRMRARPKLMLARTFEEATGLFARYRENVVAVISDMRFPRGGEEDPDAGFALVKALREQEPDLAVLVQSAEPRNAARARELGVHFADKGSARLLKEVRLFVTEALGFGDFVFRLPDRTEVGRARDMYELEQQLRKVPAASVENHATRNHFSLWLMARSMFSLAREVKPKRMEDFKDVEGMREYLLSALAEARLQQLEGVVTDFGSQRGGAGAHFVRLGAGSIGGKARGLAFVSSLLARHRLRDAFDGLRIGIPRSVVLPTQEFDRFMELNRIQPITTDAKTVRERCLAGKLSEGMRRDLRAAAATLKGPLAVRSSSLLEDSQLQPFAGIYATYMLPNNHPDPDVRFEELARAVRAVYASTYGDDARAYIRGTPYSIEEEKMAVLVQEVVGRAHGPRFYPTLSGVAVSWNYYPVGHQKAEDGLAMVALGLGQTIVQGGVAVQFSPSEPSVLPQFGNAHDYLRYSQTKFYAVDLTQPTVDFQGAVDPSLKPWDVRVAEEDGAFRLVGSVYSREDDAVRDDLSLPGPRLVTFHNLLKWDALPVAPALARLLALFREGMGCAVEVEFALDAADWGRGGRPVPTLYVLQVRPQATQRLDAVVSTEGLDERRVLCRTNRSLGHGVIDGIRDIVFVERDDLEAHETPRIAQEVGAFNAALQDEKVPYLLVGPGRWGSSDSRLGIPVKWAQIAGAKVIVETDFKDREVEPSQGAHFFHNVTSFRIGYLTLSNVDHRASAERRRIDREWLLAQPVLARSDGVRHIRLDEPLRVLLDGRKSTAAILKPGVEEVRGVESGL